MNHIMLPIQCPCKSKLISFTQTLPHVYLFLTAKEMIPKCQEIPTSSTGKLPPHSKPSVFSISKYILISELQLISVEAHILLKALLHNAIFSAICLTMVENLALQVVEFGVEALLHCAIFSATCLAMLLGTKNKKCAHTPLLKLL